MVVSHYKDIQPLWEGLFVFAIKLLYFLILLNYFSIFISPLIFFATIFIYHKMIYYLFGLKALSGFDKVFLTTSPVGRYQITSLSRFSKNFDVERLGKFLKERLVKLFPRYHSRLVKKFMEYYWYEDPDLDKACNQIVKLSPKVNSFEEALEFIGKEVNNHIDKPKNIGLNKSNLKINGHDYEVEILDTAGEEDYQNMIDMWISFGEGFLLVFAINDKESFNLLKGKHDRVLKGKHGIKCPILLVGNKQDLENERQVTYAEAKDQADLWGIEYIETSAKTDFNCKEAFEKLATKIVMSKSTNTGGGCPCVIV